MPEDGGSSKPSKTARPEKLAVRILRRLFILVLLLVCALWFFKSSVFTDVQDKEYELDEHSFTASTLAEMEKATGLKFPQATKGLKFHYIPPIDPIVFAKVEIPASGEMLIANQISALPTFNGQFHEDSANYRCQWWPSPFLNPVVTKDSFVGSYYIEAHLMHEQGKVILYLKYFTI